MNNKMPSLLLLLSLVSIPSISIAGPYGDTLSKCLVSSTTAQDKTDLVTWIFVMMSQHPEVKSLSKVTVDQLENSNKKTGLIFQRLLTQSCISETKDAIRYEGSDALGQSFNLLGQVAAREIFSAPSVAAGMAGFIKYIDKKTLDTALKPPTK